MSSRAGRTNVVSATAAADGGRPTRLVRIPLAAVAVVVRDRCSSKSAAQGLYELNSPPPTRPPMIPTALYTSCALKCTDGAPTAATIKHYSLASNPIQVTGIGPSEPPTTPACVPCPSRT